jgi:chromate transporter
MIPILRLLPGTRIRRPAVTCRPVRYEGESTVQHAAGRTGAAFSVEAAAVVFGVFVAAVEAHIRSLQRFYPISLVNRKTIGDVFSMEKVSTARFLTDVLICSLGAYGGPQSHYGVYEHQLVNKRKYISHEELIELMSLCAVLPGPTSTQTIVSVGYKMGGPRLAALTMLVWALPIVLVMGALSFAYEALAAGGGGISALRFVPAMAVGFILVAALRIGRKVVIDWRTAILFFISAGLSYFFRYPWLFPIMLIAGGAAEVLARRSEAHWTAPKLEPKWGYIVAFAVIAAAGLVLSLAGVHPLATLFERFYRYGYLVFGGGQVVVPMMYGELVEQSRLLTGEEFLAGYGLVQGLPGPMFSFASFAGGLSARGAGVLNQAAGAALGAAGIFLPGLLLIFFVYPLWDAIRSVPAIKIAISGVNAVAGGMLASAAVVIFLAAGVSIETVLVAGATAVLLGFTKIPAPFAVLLALGAGLVF